MTAIEPRFVDGCRAEQETTSMISFEAFQPGDVHLSPLDRSVGLIIREAQEADVLDLARIAADREGTSKEAQQRSFEQRLSEQRGTGEFMTLVAELCGEIIGFGKCGLFTPPQIAPANIAPQGWYLLGIVVVQKFRRRRVGAQLTAARLRWLERRASKAYYFASAMNSVTIELHREFGFVEITRDFYFPNTTFTGGVGILFEASLASRPA